MSSDNGKIKGTIGLKNFNKDCIQKIRINNCNFQNKKIDFSSIKIDDHFNEINNFSNKINTITERKTSFNNQGQNYSNNNNQDRNIQVNQFRKVNFSSFNIQQPNEQKKQYSQQTEEKKVDFQSRQHFRRPDFFFKKPQNVPQSDNTKDVKKTYQDKTFDKEKKTFNNFNKFGNKKNNFIQQKKTDRKNFFKNSSNVKIKLNDNNVKKDNNKQTFKKTANTGGNIDKYSINGMLKTMSNNIELDTEIDDVLGNVISVKLSGINTSNSLQKERKIRTSASGNENKVNFNVPIVRNVEVFNNKITLADLAGQMAISSKELLGILKKEGFSLEEGQVDDIGNIIIDGDTAEIVVNECGHKIKRTTDNDMENEFVSKIKSSRTNLKARSPIVTIMGHVDHGKTTLLDTIRKSSVASGEAGGITQHIGAYRTKVGDKWITFLDTPGHEAFTQMRARGAKVTDIVVIVVAADDGIMPQTEEAINHAKTANVPIIIAINKIDKPESDVEKTKQMLLKYGLVPEELGGDIMMIPISAKEGRNIDKLLNAILLQAEILDLKAFYSGTPEGFVIEAKMDKKRGSVATVVVKEGTLQQGDFIIAGEQYGKVKSMIDENGKMIKFAEPSMPVEILGLNAVPEAGDVFYAVKNEKEVKEILLQRQEKSKLASQKTKLSLTTEDILSQLQCKQEVKKISFIIKADTKGSLEAIINTIEKFANNEVQLRIAHSGVGAVSESDILLASTCDGYIMTFNTQKADKKILEEAQRHNVEIRNYNIIYQLFDDVKDILSGKLKPIIKKTIQGHAEVKAIFEISKVGKIAGCLVKDGIICRGSSVAVMRNNELVFETKCNSLKHGKDNVKDIQSGQECGIGLENMENINPGDVLEFFVTKEEKKSF